MIYTLIDIGKNKEKEIDFIAKNSKDTYYIQVAYSIAEPEKKEQEISSFYKIDDGYKKMQVFDFLLNENALEEC